MDIKIEGNGLHTEITNLDEMISNTGDFARGVSLQDWTALVINAGEENKSFDNEQKTPRNITQTNFDTQRDLSESLSLNQNGNSASSPRGDGQAGGIDDFFMSPFMDASPFNAENLQESSNIQNVDADKKESVPEWYFSKDLKDDMVQVIVEGESPEQMFVVDKDGNKEKLASYESGQHISDKIVRWKSGKAVTVPEELRKDGDYRPRTCETDEDKVQMDDVRFLLPKQLFQPPSSNESLDLGDYDFTLPPVSTLGPKPKPMSVPQQVQEDLHESVSSPSLASHRESLNAEQAYQAVLSAVSAGGVTSSSPLLSNTSIPLSQQLALLEQVQNLNININNLELNSNSNQGLWQQNLVNTSQPTFPLVSESLSRNELQQVSESLTRNDMSHQEGYFMEDDMMKRLDSLGLQGDQYDALIATAQQKSQQSLVGKLQAMEANSRKYDLYQSSQGQPQILGSVNNKQLNSFLDSMAIHQNLDVSQRFQGKQQSQQFPQDQLLTALVAAAQQQGHGQGTPTRAQSPLPDDKNVDKRTSYFFVAHSKRQIPEASDEETRKLFQMQLEQKKPMLAPWYRTSPRGSEDGDISRDLTPPRRIKTPPLTPKLDNHFSLPTFSRPMSNTPPPTSQSPLLQRQFVPQPFWQQSIQQQLQRKVHKVPVPPLAALDSQQPMTRPTPNSTSSLTPKKGSGVFIPKGSGVFIPGVTKLK
eukprot:TRINITY_DN2612_c0_g1_i12.p1 TRINITY_DN2612_c0_g1~~TRINITY_DN2612_c0_g1_i12.p1  ORF type:complete len:702 (-),score=120.39 TRINITY_DN2612_c0_g1_i12:723-2828(-)